MLKTIILAVALAAGAASPLLAQTANGTQQDSGAGNAPASASGGSGR